MKKKKTTKTGKSSTAKSVRNLPMKALNAKSAKGVRGGFSAVEHGSETQRSKKTPIEYIKITMKEVIVT